MAPVLFSTKHAPAHRDPQGPGDARPTALQVVEQEGMVDKLAGKTVLITGCSSGLGIETARALYQTGALNAAMHLASLAGRFNVNLLLF